MKVKTRLLWRLLFVMLPWVTIHAQNTGIDLRPTRKLTGWELYLGTYDYDENAGEDGGYVYTWKKVNEAEASKDERIMWSGDVESLDPIIRCDDFYKSPDQKSPFIQIGKNHDYAEGRNLPSAFAEKMVYDFTVTPNSTLLSFKYACVLHVPTSDDHTSYQMPAYEFTVQVTSPEGEKAGLLCSDFQAGANFEDKTFKRNDPNCTASLIEKNQKREDYIYKPWTTVCHDLTPYIGWNVHIEVIVHDCLVLVGTNRGKNKVENGGSHKAYGYFWAQTSKFELVPKNCGNDDATITAPEGFEEYKWSCRETKESLRTLPGQPNVALVPRGAIVDGAHYVCDMTGSNAACTSLSLDTVLHTIDLTADFKYENVCDQTLQFTNLVEVARDTIRQYEWDFGDGIVSVAENPKHVYDRDGNYQVTLTVTSGNGCTQTVTRNVTVESRPILNIDGLQNVCQGDPIVLSILSSAVGKEYYWLDQDQDTVSHQMGLSMTAERSQAYRAYVVDRNDCIYYKDVYVNVSPSPVLFMKGDTSVCLDTPARLMVWGDADTYSWSTGTVGETLEFIPQNTDMYWVTGIYEATKCKTTKNFKVKVNPLPRVRIEGPEEICVGQNVKLGASGASEYVWNDVYIGDTLMVAPVEPMRYSVLGTDTNGCANRAEHLISTIPKPNLQFQGNTEVCRGMSTTLVVTGASSYMWEDGSKSSTLFYTPTSSTTLRVEGTNGGCTASLDIPIKVLPVPFVMVDGNTNICYGDTLVLTASGTDRYLWNGSVAGNVFTSVPSDSAIVSVVGYNEEGCSYKVDVPYSVRRQPSLQIDGPESVCDGGNVTLTVKGDNLVQFLWNTSDVSSSITVPVLGKTVFDVKAWNAEGCWNKARHEVRTVTPPEVTYTGDVSVCQGMPVVLLASGASNYKWIENGAVVEQGNRLSFVPVSSTHLVLEGTLYNCTRSVDIDLTVKKTPDVEILGPQNACRHDTVSLTATGADFYEWSTGDTTSTISYPMITSLTYMVNGKLNNGCSSKKSINVELYRDLSVSLEEIDKQGCPGMPTTVHVGASGGLVYSWSSEPYNLTISGTTSYDIEALITEPTEVFVEATDEHGCRGWDTLHIEPKDTQNVTYQILPAILEKSDRTIHCDGFQPKNATWTWKMGDGSEMLEGKNVSHTYSEMDVVTEDSFKVVVKAVDPEGCVYENSTYMYVWKDFWAPTVFSPNGDGLNDKFSFLGGEYIDDFQFVIYNRLGQVVFEGQSIEDEWDGTYRNGDPCPQEIYGWTVTYKSNYKGIGRQEEKKGFITILK